MASDDNAACCACRRVTSSTIDNEDGTVTDRWECNTCGAEFVRAFALRARVAELEKVERHARRVDALWDAENRVLMLNSRVVDGLVDRSACLDDLRAALRGEEAGGGE